MADNLLLLFVGWEGVGLCSYLLIGFWYEDPNNTIAGNKAFIVNRIGDFGFILGIFLLVTELGRQGIWTLDFAELQKHVQIMNPATIGLITLLLFIGATGKSAQIPLFVWLPDAMAGPTPVSALIHAATMVTAGVYMTARLHFLFALAPATLSLIAWIGAATAFFAATIALTQNDIKKVLAYSTVSQLGYMFLGPGRGRVQRGDLSCVHPCVFQGLPVSRRRQRDTRSLRRTEHAQDGRAQGSHAEDLLDLCRRHAGDRGRAVDGGIFFQGLDFMAGLQPRRVRPLGHRRGHSRHDRLLHVSPALHGISRRVPRRSSRQGASARVAGEHDLAFDHSRRRLDLHRLVGRAGISLG